MPFGAMIGIPARLGKTGMIYDAVRLLTALALVSMGTQAARAQSEDPPPAAAETRDTGRIFLDGRVSEVYIDNLKTIAVMPQAPQSNCPSDQYVYERDRPKWMFETGRLLVAAEEQADIRISFTCYSGQQSINAIQFLSPANERMVSGTPTQGRLVPTAIDPQIANIPTSRTPAARETTRAPDAPATAGSTADAGLTGGASRGISVLPPPTNGGGTPLPGAPLTPATR